MAYTHCWLAQGQAELSRLPLQVLSVAGFICHNLQDETVLRHENMPKSPWVSILNPSNDWDDLRVALINQWFIIIFPTTVVPPFSNTPKYTATIARPWKIKTLRVKIWVHPNRRTKLVILGFLSITPSVLEVDQFDPANTHFAAVLRCSLFRGLVSSSVFILTVQGRQFGTARRLLLGENFPNTHDCFCFATCMSTLQISYESRKALPVCVWGIHCVSICITNNIHLT